MPGYNHPGTRTPPHRPSRHVITLTDLTTANWQVIDEMEIIRKWEFVDAMAGKIS